MWEAGKADKRTRSESDKDRPLRDDIRLLGRILGDTIREREGAATLESFFAGALVSPVLTAHPTEVRRKSTLDREMEIASLLDQRERALLTPEEMKACDDRLRQAIYTLWQTNLLRRTKLTVLDEVENGLSYYDYTFLHEIPCLLRALEDDLESASEDGQPVELRKADRRGDASALGGNMVHPTLPPYSYDPTAHRYLYPYND